MSDWLPFEIQVQIIEKLPVKSVIQCRSVSKSWKSLIDSSEFIARYSFCQTQPERLLIRYKVPLDSKETYVSFVDDDTFPKQKFALTVPLMIKELKHSILVGNCQGLFCLYGYAKSDTRMAVLWNPSIRKVVFVALPKLFVGLSSVVLGFGVCPGSNDLKIIRFCNGYSLNGKTCISRQVEVFSLSKGTWRSLTSNLPSKSIEFMKDGIVVLDRFVYWSASKVVPTQHDAFQRNKMIMSFDLSTDEFQEVYLPNSLALNHSYPSFICKLRDSLAVIDNGSHFRNQSYDVWMMEDGVPKSFVKLFSIKAPDVYIHKKLGFLKSGKPILEVRSGCESLAAPAVYEPCLEQVNKIQIDGLPYSFFVESYTETLLLLDQPDFSSY